MFLNDKFWHFLDWQKFLIEQYIYGIKGLVIHNKFLNANLFLIKTFLITKFDCTSYFQLKKENFLLFQFPQFWTNEEFSSFLTTQTWKNS